jgi:GTP cyclohydrolase I
VDLFAGSACIDVEAAERAAAALLAALGVPEGTEVALRTPARMVAGLAELLTVPRWSFTTFPNDEGHHELVLVRDVPFTSVCAHHLLPFAGVAQVGVLPGERIAGLSKLARTVTAFAARLQVQEELGQQISGFLEEQMECRGVGVVLCAEHLCMTRRGVRASGMTIPPPARSSCRWRCRRRGGPHEPPDRQAVRFRGGPPAGRAAGGTQVRASARPFVHRRGRVGRDGVVRADLDPVKAYLAQVYDHRHLSEVVDVEPTSENLARVLFDWCIANLSLPRTVAVEAVRVSETPATWAEYRPAPAT